MKKIKKPVNALKTSRLARGLLFAAPVAAVTALLLVPRDGEVKMPDFRPLETQQRKADFFGFLTPIVASVNAHIAREKVRLQSLARGLRDGAQLSWSDRRWIHELGKAYKVSIGEKGVTSSTVATLLLRVDVVPEPLVLVQAAKESGWGTSRFAVQGNNLFGQRCYMPGCGIPPKGAESGVRFGLAHFDSVRDSVVSYIRNLNTHPQYRSFRELRKSLRDANEPLDPLILAGQLGDYSERGGQYVAEIKTLIRQNHDVEDE